MRLSRWWLPAQATIVAVSVVRAAALALNDATDNNAVAFLAPPLITTTRQPAGNVAESLASSLLLHTPPWYGTQDPLPQQPVGLLEEDDYVGRYLEDRVITQVLFPRNYAGIIVEIGGNDGIVFSSSLALEQKRGWRSIIVEGDPVIAKYAPQLRPNAVVVNAVVCHDWGIIHFAPMGTQGGILETMPRFILKHFHPYLLEGRGKGGLTKETLQHAKVPVVGCVPLGWMLQQLNVPAIDVLFIDINGAELSALSSVDFGKVRVDVVAVNVDEQREDPVTQPGCVAYMEQFGYLPWTLKDVPVDRREDWMDDLHANRIQWFIRPASLPAVHLGLSESAAESVRSAGESG